MSNNNSKPEKGLSEKLNLISKYLYVKNIKLHYVEKGKGDPILFLHGIPANLYLWRNVIPEVSGANRAIALDLAGFGKSDVPASGGYDANNQYAYLEGFIEEMGLKNLTLVMTDLGSLLGMKYAADHPENIKGIVNAEGMIMPALEYYEQLSLMQKMMYAVFRNKSIAKSIIVNGTRIQSNIVPMMTLRKLTKTEKFAYTAPYADKEKRKLVFEGPGPVSFPKKQYLKPETATDESLALVVMMNENARKLKNTKIPMLVLYADPGVILSEKGRAYAEKNYPNLTLKCVGKGKHFIPEDHPKAMGQFIKNWLEEINN